MGKHENVAQAAPARVVSSLAKRQRESALQRMIRALQVRERANGVYPAPSLSTSDAERLIARFAHMSSLSGKLLGVDDMALGRRDPKRAFDTKFNVALLSRSELRRRARLMRGGSPHSAAHQRAVDEMQRIISVRVESTDLLRRGR